MEEIALVVSSLAGACTAVALDKIPRRKARQTLTVNSAVENQLHSLNIEKEILTKTITRLHNDQAGIPNVQRDKLLIRYQHQIGAIAAKIEKLETASRYPDLGPVGDSIISMMDSRLSKMDQRLHEIASKMTASPPQMPPQAPPSTVQRQVVVQSQQVQQPRPEPPKPIVQEKPKPEAVAPKAVLRETIEVEEEKMPEPPAVHVHVPERHVSVELSTLTTIPSKMPEFPAEFIKPPVTVEKPKVADAEPKPEEPQLIVPVEPTPLAKAEEPPAVAVPSKPGPAVEKKAELPTPIKIPEEEKIEDDDKDLDKIKSEIMRALSKLEQVEVE